MKHYSNALIALAIAGSVGLVGCNSLSQMTKMAKQQDLKVDPNPLELHGGVVSFKMSAKLPVKMLKKDTEYELKVFFVNDGAKEGQETFKKEVGSITFVSNDYLPQSNKEEPRIEKAMSFEYEAQFERGELAVKGFARSTKKSKEKSTVQMPIAKGVITTSTLIKDILDEPYGLGNEEEGTFIILEHGYGKEEVKQVYVDFNFEQGSAKLQSAEVRDKGAAIDAFVASKMLVGKDGKSTVNIKGSHSPEGRETINRNLADQRAAVMKQYYLDQMKKYNYAKEELAKVNFDITTQTLDETLPEFFSLLDANTTLTAEQKKEIKNIMQGKEGFVEREKSLQSKPYYSVLMSEVYPKLRYARTDVLQGPKQKTDAEIASLARQIAKGEKSTQELTEAELLYAASMTPDMEEKVAIYGAAIKKNDSYVAHNNLAAVQLEMALKETDKAKREKLVSDAITHLEIAKNRKETAEVNYNLGLAYAMKGDKGKGEQAINRAIEIGSDNPATLRKLNGAKGIMLMKQAKSYDDKKYVEAEQAFAAAGNGHKVLFNKALAQLLHRDYDKAMVSFDAAIKSAPNDGLSYYGKAITAARKGNAAEMLKALKKAIELNGDLRARAAKDLEFINYFNSTEFQDAIR